MAILFRSLSLAMAATFALLFAPRSQALAGGGESKKKAVEGLPGELEKEGYVSIPLLPMKSGLTGLSVRINGEHLDFVVDTGACRSCLDASRLKNLKLDWQATGVAKQSFYGEMPQKVSKVDCIEIGPFKTGHLIVEDSSRVKQLPSDGDSPGDGLLGADIFERYHAVIDYANLKLYLRPRVHENVLANPLKTLHEGNGYISVPLQRFNSKHIVIEAYVSKKRILLVVDTGAIVSTLNQGRTKGFGLNWITVESERRQRNNVKWAFCDIDGIKLGSLETGLLRIWNDEFVPIVNRINATWDDPPLDGILGLNILQSHQAIIDYTTNRLFLRISPLTGRVKLINSSQDDLTIKINGVVHRVAPSTSVSIENVPSGIFRYEINSKHWGTLKKGTAEVHAGETITITAN